VKCIEIQIPPLPQMITVGHSIWEPGMIHFRRNFPVYDLLFVKKGCLFMTGNEIPYEICEGGILVLEPGKTHWGHRPCEDNMEVYWVHLKHGEAKRTLDSHQIPWSTVIRHGQDQDWEPVEESMFLPKMIHTNLNAIFQILDELLILHQHFMMDTALQLHMKVAQLLHELQNIVRSNHHSRTLTLSEQVSTYLQQHFADELKMADLEAALNYDIDYLSRCFKFYTGMTPLQYLHHIRLERAKSLLTNTDLPIHRIAEQVGMNNYNYFHRLFRTKVGTPPGEYRAMMQGQQNHNYV
jgi:AraC-like DNA-binding protein